MTQRALAFIKVLRNLNSRLLADELLKLGVYVKQYASRQDFVRAVDGLDPQSVENYLASREAPVAVEPPSHELPVLDPLSFTRLSTLSPDFTHFQHSLIKIHRNYLNQISPIAAFQPPSEGSLEGRSVDELLGVRREVQLEPRRIVFEYQKGSETVRKELFANADEVWYRNELKKIKLLSTRWKEFVDVPSAQHRLLLSYGYQKEQQFFNESTDFLEELLYPSHIKPRKRRELVAGFIFSFREREDYYTAVISTITPTHIGLLLANVDLHIDATFTPGLLHGFALALSRAILCHSSVLRPPITNNSRLILDWISKRLAAFRSYFAASRGEKFGEEMAESVRRYEEVAELARQAVGGQEWGLQEWEWRLEEVVEEVGVAELGGRRVTEKLKLSKLILERVANSETELSPELLSKLLISIRSGIEWMMSERQLPSRQLLTDELQMFFGEQVCDDLIRLLFRSQKVSIDLQSIIAFLWDRKFGAALDTQAIQSVFLLANVTVSYRSASVLDNRQQQAYSLLTRSVAAIAAQGTQFNKDIVGFLIEEVAQLLHEPLRQQYLQEVSAAFPAYSMNPV